MADAQTAFADLVSALFREFARDLGFSRERNTFRRSDRGNTALIQVQKSSKSERTRVSFTVNLGVFSAAATTGDPPRRPSLEDCHWRERIGFLLPGRRDTWWEVDATTNVDRLKAELVTYLRSYALPVLISYLDDSKLRDLWLSGKSPGLTEFQRLRNLLALLWRLGPRELVPPIEEELRRLG